MLVALAARATRAPPFVRPSGIRLFWRETCMGNIQNLAGKIFLQQWIFGGKAASKWKLDFWRESPIARERKIKMGISHLSRKPAKFEVLFFGSRLCHH
jgi:hypothetical protein